MASQQMLRYLRRHRSKLQDRSRRAKPDKLLKLDSFRSNDPVEWAVYSPGEKDKTNKRCNIVQGHRKLDTISLYPQLRTAPGGDVVFCDILDLP